MTDSDSDNESTTSSSSEEHTPPSRESSIPNQSRVTSPTHSLVDPLARLALSDRMSVRGEPSTPRGGSRAEAPSTDGDSRGLNVAKPDLFYGERRKFEAFITQLQLNFLSDTRRFQDEQDRVIFAETFLRGPALDWFKPVLDDRLNNGNRCRPETTTLFTWTGFVAGLKRMYGDVDERRTAERKLEGLRQSASVANYAATFQQYTPRIGWNQEALVAQFRQGLKSDIKDMLVHHLTLLTTLNGFINLCIKLDQRVIERRYEKGGKAP
jgi:hypothetical protein